MFRTRLALVCPWWGWWFMGDAESPPAWRIWSP